MLPLMAMVLRCPMSFRNTAEKVTATTCGTQSAPSPQTVRQIWLLLSGLRVGCGVAAACFEGAAIRVGGSCSQAQVKAAMIKQKAARIP
jgi:hypothetical protein